MGSPMSACIRETGAPVRSGFESVSTEEGCMLFVLPISSNEEGSVSTGTRQGQ